METEIGDAAGIIWQYLDQHGGTSLRKLREGTKLSDHILLMALGWLAREGKLSFGKEGRTLKIGLRERTAA
jgi:hypothetical protein